ncbi:hypothetical protein [Novilysobacter arseniciresistens]|uniref:hypothetical protein n=1 Tax=Novilysobacter arseniciresistens TaxID=1385522 RepID=UPI001269E5AC|nr:hypothetical protein [Lysobacter arseniciresistens]
MSNDSNGFNGIDDALIRNVASLFVHRLFPSFRRPAYLGCPNELIEQAVLAAIARSASERGVIAEVVDLRPAPADRLNHVTARLADARWHGTRSEGADIKLLILRGFDLLEGSENDVPTYPFRSEFQFDENHVWLFVGRDWRRLNRMFNGPKLPLYMAATSCTPKEWRN